MLRGNSGEIGDLASALNLDINICQALMTMASASCEIIEKSQVIHRMEILLGMEPSTIFHLASAVRGDLVRFQEFVRSKELGDDGLFLLSFFMLAGSRGRTVFISFLFFHLVFFLHPSRFRLVLLGIFAGCS